MSSTAGAAPSVLQTARRADRQFGTFVWQQHWIQTNPMLPPKNKCLVLGAFPRSRSIKLVLTYSLRKLEVMSDTDDFLSDTAVLFGKALPDDGTIRYGPLVLTGAPKVLQRL